jgi:lipopolysaccharide transport system permease protein
MEARANSDEREVVIAPSSPWSLRELGAAWTHRELLWILALRDVSVRYKQALFGVAWALAQPASQMVIFTVLFHRLAHVGSEAGLPYPLFCFSGLVVWQLFANGLGRASESLTGNSSLVTKVYFPRLLLPLASVLAATVDFALAFVSLIAMALVWHVPLHATALLALPLALAAALTACAFGLWTSALNLQFRDVRHALPFVLQLLVYTAPVLYPSSLIPERWRMLTALNPMAPIVESFRAALFGLELPLARLGVSLAVTAVVGVLGLAYFGARERTFADQI